MKLLRRVRVLADMPVSELRRLHPDGYEGPVRGASRGECIEAILTEELSDAGVFQAADRLFSEDTPWWLDDSIALLKKCVFGP